MGAVGDGTGIEFLSWLEHLDLPDPEAVLADPDSFELPERSDRAFAVMTAVATVGDRRRRPAALEQAWRVVCEGRRARARRRDARRAHARLEPPGGRASCRGGAPSSPRSRARPARGVGVRAEQLDELPLELGAAVSPRARVGAHQAPTGERIARARAGRGRARRTASRRDLSAFPTDAPLARLHRPDSLGACEVPELGFWLLHQVGHLLAGDAPSGTRSGDRDDVSRSAGARRAATVESRDRRRADDDLSTEELVLPARAVRPERLGAPAEPDGEDSGTARTRRAGSSALADERRARLRQRLRRPGPPWDCAGRLSQPRCSAGRPQDGAANPRPRPAAVARLRRAGCVGPTSYFEPTVDWRRELAPAQIRRGAADVAGRVDFSYRRRRAPPGGGARHRAAEAATAAAPRRLSSSTPPAA